MARPNPAILFGSIAAVCVFLSAAPSHAAPGSAAPAPAARPFPARPKPHTYPALDGFMLRPFSVALGLGAGGIGLRPDINTEKGISDPWGLTMDLRFGFLSLLFVDAGFSTGVGRDRRPMTGTLCRIFDPSDCFTAETQIDATTVYAKTGLVLRYFQPIGDGWTLQTAFVPGVGYRGAWFHRQLMCTGCPFESVGVDGGVMLSPELDVSLASNEDGASKLGGAFGLRFEYEYFPASELASAFWVKLLVEVL